MSVRVFVCVCGWVPLASDSSETIEVMITKRDTETASDIRLHGVFIILTTAFIQGHTSPNYGNDTCSITLETVQAM